MNAIQDNAMTIDPALRSFVITMTDAPWSSPKARAAGMRKLEAAQLGSLGKLDSIKFVQKLAEQTIRRLLPPILRQIGWDGVAKRCEQEGTEEAAEAAAYVAANSTWAAAEVANVAFFARLAAYAACNAARAAANAARVARAAADATYAACNAAANAAAYAADYADIATEAADAANAARDGVLTLMCDICIDILREMEAPGIALMDQVC